MIQSGNLNVINLGKELLELDGLGHELGNHIFFVETRLGSHLQDRKKKKKKKRKGLRKGMKRKKTEEGTVSMRT